MSEVYDCGLVIYTCFNTMSLFKAYCLHAKTPSYIPASCDDLSDPTGARLNIWYTNCFATWSVNFTKSYVSIS